MTSVWSSTPRTMSTRSLEVVGDRRLTAIICTHAHDDHVLVAPALQERTGAPIMLHPDDRVLWEMSHPDVRWDADLPTANVSRWGAGLMVLHTPGHAPGRCVCTPRTGLCVLRGHLFQGGPGATGRSFSDRPTIEASIRSKLFALPDETVVHTGTGPTPQSELSGPCWVTSGSGQRVVVASHAMASKSRSAPKS